jgi:hypothetical protein
MNQARTEAVADRGLWFDDAIPMLTIRPEQIQAFEAHLMRQYEDRVIANLTKAYPDRFKAEDKEKTRAFVQAGVRKAAPYGITEDDDTEAFIFLLSVHGMDFEKPPERVECRAILEDKDLEGDAKVSLLRRELNPKTADSAKR